jgi:heavy metal sensor kinase
MRSGRPLKLRGTLAFRLTLWYAGIFLVSAAVAFAFFYYLVTQTLRGRTDQELLADVRSFSSVMLLQGVEAVKRQALLESHAAGEKKIFVQLLYPDGRLFSSSNMSYFSSIPISREAIVRMLQSQEPVFATVSSPDHQHEIRVVYALLGPGLVLHLGQAMEGLTRFIEVFQRIFILTLAALFLVAVAVGWFMARRAMSGVEEVTRTARRISEGLLGDRVPVTRSGDEIDQLAATFNLMLDRIQTLVAGIREMSDNIAHDLKTPLTRIRGQAELALATGGPLEDLAGTAVEECDRLLAMIDAMLFISRTEAGVTRPERKPLDLAGLVREACELFRTLAEDKRIRLSCSTPESLPLAADAPLVQRLVANLLDNAIKYTPEEGEVQVALALQEDRWAVLRVRDTGPGISAADRPHIFERFYRGDPSRSQPGAGLGLSFARAVARAHGGDIAMEDSAGGSMFTARIPTAW